MRCLGIVVRRLFILCLPMLLLTASITWAANSLWLYQHGFEKYDVSRTTGLAEAELDRVARELITYFRSGDKHITLTVVKDGEPVELFTEREIIHLWEVKMLFRLVYYLLASTLAFVIVYSAVMLRRQRGRAWRVLSSGILKASILTLGVMGAAALAVIAAFGPLFWWFHEILFFFFEGDYWILDPAKHYLIQLFPQGFWYDAFLLCGGITAGLAVILGGVSGRYLLLKRRVAV